MAEKNYREQPWLGEERENHVAKRQVRGYIAFVRDSCIENPDNYTIHSKIKSDKDVEAVGHNPEPDARHDIAAIFEVSFENLYLAKMLNRIL